ncbi:DEKNAAC104125 [Brettanomyces naardenensis]|uniref:DNA polymerase epsilon subunit D n=1 Tax=Brettanomyces naardenensis TaxID=13370 RepID=A0A448YQE3_BRENA|nr:DEKNAAC104125 [Brettanomyces naardenensis]
MPAKGWRKDEQESNLETAMANQKVSIDSILFPKATLNKLVRQVLEQESPDANPMILAKESQTVIQRASVVFINYIYHNAKQYIKAKGRKVVNAEDIITAMETTNFNSFVPVLREELESFNKRKEIKKRDKLNKQNVKVDESIDDEEVANANDNKRLKLDGDGADESEETIEERDEEKDGEKDDEDDGENGENEEQGVDGDDDDDEEEEEEPPLSGTQRMELEQKELEGENDKEREVVDLDDEEGDEDGEEGK